MRVRRQRRRRRRGRRKSPRRERYVVGIVDERGKAEQARQVGELVHLSLQAGVAGEVGPELRVLAGREVAEDEATEVFTVPSGRPRRSAISLWLS